uniref:Uncharacterized protein n=1 Tax=Oryza barthii TaxID=65489 RepID=A0A0D3H617_9ORYZ
MSASGLHGATRTDSSPQAAAPPPAADNSSHHVAADVLFGHLQYSSNNGLDVAATTTMIAVLIDLADKIKKRSGRGRGSRPAAVLVAMALVMLLAVAALVNPTAAARPEMLVQNKAVHDDAAAAAAAPAMTVAVVNDAVTVTGHSGCTNDPNTLEPWRCVHH